MSSPGSRPRQGRRLPVVLGGGLLGLAALGGAVLWVLTGFVSGNAWISAQMHSSLRADYGADTLALAFPAARLDLIERALRDRPAGADLGDRLATLVADLQTPVPTVQPGPGETARPLPPTRTPTRPPTRQAPASTLTWTSTSLPSPTASPTLAPTATRPVVLPTRTRAAQDPPRPTEPPASHPTPQTVVQPTSPPPTAVPTAVPPEPTQAPPPPYPAPTWAYP